MAADGGIGQHGDTSRLHFEDAAGHKDEGLLGLADKLDADRSRLDAGDEGNVLGIDPQLTRLARQRDELGLAFEDRFFSADDVDLDGTHLMVFAFSKASSIVPTM